MLTREQAVKLTEAARAQGATREQIRAILVRANERASQPKEVVTSPERQALIDSQGDRELSREENISNVLAPALTGLEALTDTATLGLSSAVANLLDSDVNEAQSQLQGENRVAQGVGTVAGFAAPAGLVGNAARGGVNLARGALGATSAGRLLGNAAGLGRNIAKDVGEGLGARLLKLVGGGKNTKEFLNQGANASSNISSLLGQGAAKAAAKKKTTKAVQDQGSNAIAQLLSSLLN